MSQQNNSQQEEIISISASELNDGDDRYQGLLEMMDIENLDFSETPSSAPRNNTFVNLIKMALNPLEVVSSRR